MVRCVSEVKSEGLGWGCGGELPLKIRSTLDVNNVQDEAALGLTCDMCDLYCTVWKSPPPTDNTTISLIKGRLAVFPKDTLSGDVLDESSVQSLLQRWDPHVSRRFPIKQLMLLGKKKRKESSVKT